jgi:hypothetical protein
MELFLEAELAALEGVTGKALCLFVVRALFGVFVVNIFNFAPDVNTESTKEILKKQRFWLFSNKIGRPIECLSGRCCFWLLCFLLLFPHFFSFPFTQTTELQGTFR